MAALARDPFLLRRANVRRKGSRSRPIDPVGAGGLKVRVCEQASAVWWRGAFRVPVRDSVETWTDWLTMQSLFGWSDYPVIPGD